MIAYGFYISDAKDLCEIPTGSPPTRAPNRDVVGSNGDFRPISRYISETVQRWLLWKANKNSYVLYRLVLFPVTSNNFNYPNHPIFDILYRILCLCSEWS